MIFRSDITENLHKFAFVLAFALMLSFAAYWEDHTGMGTTGTLIKCYSDILHTSFLLVCVLIYIVWAHLA